MDHLRSGTTQFLGLLTNNKFNWKTHGESDYP